MKQPSVRINLSHEWLTQLQSYLHTAIELSASMCKNPYHNEHDICQLGKLSYIKGLVDMMLLLNAITYEGMEAIFKLCEDAHNDSVAYNTVARLEIKQSVDCAMDIFADIPIPFVIADKEPVSEGNTPSCPIPEECHQVGCMFACDDEVQS